MVFDSSTDSNSASRSMWDRAPLNCFETVVCSITINGNGNIPVWKVQIQYGCCPAFVYMIKYLIIADACPDISPACCTSYTLSHQSILICKCFSSRILHQIPMFYPLQTKHFVLFFYTMMHQSGLLSL